MTATHSQSNGGKTGWPPGLLQDDSKKLTEWFASRIDARHTLRKVLDEMEDHRMTHATRTIQGHTVTVTGPDAEGLMRRLVACSEVCKHISTEALEHKALCESRLTGMLRLDVHGIGETK